MHLQFNVANDQMYFYQFPEKYPQIKKLFGVDPTFKWKVAFLVAVQMIMLVMLREQSWPVIIITAYVFGGVINHALMLGNLVPVWTKQLIPLVYTVQPKRD